MVQKGGKHLLVVDDDRKLRELLTRYLEGEGFTISSASDASEARKKVSENSYDLMIVDVMMPGEDGISLTKSIKQDKTIPILILTAMGEPDDRIRGLEFGADDYLVKPFEPRELSLRIRNLLERKTATSPIVRFGDFIFNIDKGDLRKNNEIISISSTELSLLKLLALHLNQPVSREEISKNLNGISERSVDVQITRLRKKIEDDPANPIYIQTARSQGYILRDVTK